MHGDDVNTRSRVEQYLLDVTVFFVVGQICSVDSTAGDDGVVHRYINVVFVVQVSISIIDNYLRYGDPVT